MPDIRDSNYQGPKFQPGNLLWFILPAIAIIATITCFYTVQPEEEGGSSQIRQIP